MQSEGAIIITNRKDERKHIEWIIKTHGKRTELLAQRIKEREALVDQIAAIRFAEINRGNVAFSDPTASKAGRLGELDTYIKKNQELVDAVEAAFRDLGAGYSPACRQEMRIAFQLSFENSRRYGPSVLSYPFARKLFFKHRRAFIDYIGKRLGYTLE